MKTIIAIVLMLALTGCATKMYPIDSTLIDDNTATIIVYWHGGCCDSKAPIYFDGVVIGHVTQDKPLRFAAKQGFHSLHTRSGQIDRITSQEFVAGRVYHMKLWLDLGYWVSSFRITQTHAVDSYEAQER